MDWVRGGSIVIMAGSTSDPARRKIGYIGMDWVRGGSIVIMAGSTSDPALRKIGFM